MAFWRLRDPDSGAIPDRGGVGAILNGSRRVLEIQAEGFAVVLGPARPGYLDGPCVVERSLLGIKVGNQTAYTDLEQEMKPGELI